MKPGNDVAVTGLAQPSHDACARDHLARLPTCPASFWSIVVAARLDSGSVP